MEQQAGERELDVGEPERHPRAHPPAGAERQELEVGALELHGAGLVGLEPLGPELLGVAGPVPPVAAQRPDVDEHGGARRHVVAEHAARLLGLPREQQRQRRVQPERLPDDELQVPELAQRVLRHRAARAEGLAHLGRRPLHRLRVPDQLRHRPLQRGRRRLAAGAEDVLHRSRQTEAGRH